MQVAIDSNISTIPQPRKPSQATIAETISVASKLTTILLFRGADKD
jgi:hypothetical protein